MTLLKDLFIRSIAGFLALALLITLFHAPFLVSPQGFLAVFIALFFTLLMAWKLIFLLLVPVSIVLDRGIYFLEQKLKIRSKLGAFFRFAFYFLTGYFLAVLFYGDYYDSNIFILFGPLGIWILSGVTSVLFHFLHRKLARSLGTVLSGKWEKISERFSRSSLKKINIVVTCLVVLFGAFIYREAFRNPEERLSPLSLEILSQLDDEFRLTEDVEIRNINKPSNAKLKPGDEYLIFEIRNRDRLTEEIFKNAKRIVIKHAVRVAFHFKATNSMHNIKAIHSFFTPTNDLGFVGQFDYLLVMDDFEEQLLSLENEGLSKEEIIEKLVEHFHTEVGNPSK